MRGVSPRPDPGRTAPLDPTREGHHHDHRHRARHRREPGQADPGRLQADPEFGRLWEGCAKYSSDWDDFYGYPIILDHDPVADAPALFSETTRAMALKSAMYELTDC
ncbi:hypothetical protein ABT115_15410 [Streptomyces sp. NPDC001832]|uniref:hypothetical protein n=1 Tax=Streptomyces sp. NPDC001832 TaxID=3154527 RepID=UPI00332A3B86